MPSTSDAVVPTLSIKEEVKMEDSIKTDSISTKMEDVKPDMDGVTQQSSDPTASEYSSIADDSASSLVGVVPETKPEPVKPVAKKGYISVTALLQLK